MNRFLPLFGAILLTGCGLSEEKYAQKSAEEACSLYEECDLLDFFGGDYETCVTTLEEATLAYVTSDACDYDGGAAKSCLNELKDLSCEADTSTDTSSSSACDDVCGDTSTAE
ncbi:MAG: hypothetical protein H6742_05285 [Alphaproteobacteria bacterium]|nr:hypothetical protein [Alphaproteobacteria bacterium]